MNWKQIEQKPANWELLQRIIRQSRSQELSFASAEAAKGAMLEWRRDILDSFLEMLEKSFPCVKSVIRPLPSASNKSSSTTTQGQGRAHKSGGGQKHKQQQSRKHLIHEQVNKRQLDREWGVLRLDPETMAPALNGRFTFHISQVAFIIWWAVSAVTAVAKSDRVSGAKYKTAVNALLSLEKTLAWLEPLKDSCASNDQPVWMDWLHVTGRVEALLKERWTGWQIVAINCLFRYPQFMVKCYFDEQDSQAGLYPEQINFISIILDAILFDQPLLLGDQRPPGTGKTFMAAPLAQKLSVLDRKTIVVFTCPNELVRIDVARNALLADNLHVWMGRKAYIEEKDNAGFFVRPHKSCFPTNWKKVYKASDHEKQGNIYDQFLFYTDVTERWPDIIVCDMETCEAVLKTAELADHMVLLMDEVISNDTGVQKQIVDLLRYCPRVTVLMSSILPPWTHLPSFVGLFTNRHNVRNATKSIRRIETEHDVSISCTLIDPEGFLCMPHHKVEWSGVSALVSRLRADPLLGRMFPPQHVHAMIKTIKNLDEPRFQLRNFFPRIRDITHQNTRRFMVELLEYLVASDLEPVFAELQAYRPRLLSHAICDAELLTHTFQHLEGKTLTAVSNDGFAQHLDTMTQPFLEDAPKIAILEQERKKCQQMKDLREKELKNTKGMSATERQMELSDLREINSTDLQWPSTHVYQSHAHYQRFGCEIQRGQRDYRSPSLPMTTQEGLDEWTLQLLLGRLGVYENKLLTGYQRMMIMDAFGDLGMIFSGRELVFGTNISNLTNLCILSSFGDTANRGVLYQLIGRIGRVGHSYEARVLTSSQRVMDLIFAWRDEADEGYVDPVDALFACTGS